MTPRQAASHLWELGANITAIPAGGKRPAYEWNNPNAPWASQRQPKGYVDSLHWPTAPHLGRGGRLYQPIETIGVICGVGANVPWRNLDIDARKAPDGTKIPVPEAVKDALLAALGLPADYPWAGRSTSGAGWHIDIRCAGDLPEQIAHATTETRATDGGGTGVKIGLPRDTYADAFSHIELRWEQCQAILPRPTGYNGHLPATPPAEVTVDQVVTAFLTVATPKASPAPPTRPSIHHTSARPNAHTAKTFDWDEIVRASLRTHFDLVAWFCQELGGETQDEPGGEVRILGHHGLMVNADKASWYIHGEGVGGDWAAAVAHTRYGGQMPSGSSFFDLVQIAAAFADVLLPVRTRSASVPLVISPRPSTLSPDQIALLNRLNRTDTGNAEALALLYGDDLRYCANRKKWLRWNGSHWQTDDIGYSYRTFIDVVRQRYLAATGIDDLDTRKRAAAWAISSENNTKLEAGLKCASRLEPFATTITTYDVDPMLATTPSATLDLHTGTARPADRADYMSMTLGTTYDADATSPRWERFLDEIFGSDQELIAYIQRVIGYCLTGDTSEQKIFLCHGGGANGKSTFLEVLTWLLGDYSANASFDTFDAGRRSEATNDLAALKGRRLVTVIETEEDRRLAEARVKAVTGGDLITARFLYGEFFSYRPQFKIWLAMNHKPVIRGTDRGIWRRLALIPFSQNFEGREDRTLRETLRAELPGILNWALAGLRAWHASGLGQCIAVTAATQAYQEESDQVGRWLSDNTVSGRSHTVRATAAYADYVRWCEASGEHPFSQTMWGRRLTERGIRRERLRGAWHLIGFGLLSHQSEPDTSPDSDTPLPSQNADPDPRASEEHELLTLPTTDSIAPASTSPTSLPSGWSMLQGTYGWWVSNGCGIGSYQGSPAEAVAWAWAQIESPERVL
jgi:putative DNA primase/helicase